MHLEKNQLQLLNILNRMAFYEQVEPFLREMRHCNLATTPETREATATIHDEAVNAIVGDALAQIVDEVEVKLSFEEREQAREGRGSGGAHK